MSGRNFNKSSLLLKYMIFLYFVLLSSNCHASPSLLTGIKGKNKEKTDVTDVLQNIIMRQFTLISECMSKQNSDIRNDFSINKKTVAQTRTELIIMKEENKQLREQLSKIKIELSNYKVTTDQTLARRDDMNSYKEKFSEIYENKTQELIERLDKQDDRNEQRQLKQDNDSEGLKNVINQLKESYNSLKQSHQNDKQKLIIQLKEKDDKIDEQSKRLLKQEKIDERFENEIRELKKSHQSLKEIHKNEIQKLVIQLKEHDDNINEQNKRLLKQERINERFENEIRELNESHHSLNENNQIKTQKLVIQLKENDDIIKNQNTKLQELHGKLKKFQNYRKIVWQGKRQQQQNKDIQKLGKLFVELNENHKNDSQELFTRLKDQDDLIASQNKTLMTINAKVDVLDKIQCKFGTCRDVLLSVDKKYTRRSGVFILDLNGTCVPVWCDMETDGGGWTVIQRRQNGNVDFHRTWKEYKAGFGNVWDEYWIGNDALHVLTSPRKMKLRVDLQQFNGTKGHATFSTFAVANEVNKYRLSLSGYAGEKRIGDCFYHNNGKQFSTKDRDNDGWSFDNCAVYHYGGWWYRSCTNSNLNGRYYTSATENGTSVYCYQWTGTTRTSLKTTTMMIR